MGTSDDILDLLQTLSDAHGVSGYEDDIRRTISTRLEPLGGKHRVDALGNLIIEFPCDDQNAPLLLLDAHMDEIGLLISFVEKDGFLRFTTVGGWDERVLPAHAVDVRTESGEVYRGVIGTPPPHILKPEDRNKPFKIEELFIDVGARSADEVAAMGIRVGDSALPSYPFARLGKDVVMGKALDNRAGCTVLIRVLEEIYGGKSAPPPVRIIALFSTFEEIGARGAQVASYGIDPDIALVLEGTIAADCPGVPAARNPSRQTGGPVLTLMDKSAFLPRRLVSYIEKIAARNDIPCQLKTPTFGGTNAARIHMVRSGVATAVMAAPCRYIHGPHAILRRSDLEHTVNLARHFVYECRGYLESSSD